MIGINGSQSLNLDTSLGDPSQNASTQSIQFLEQLLQMIQFLLQQMQGSGDDSGGTPSVGGASSPGSSFPPAAASGAPMPSSQGPSGAPGATQPPQTLAATAPPTGQPATQPATQPPAGAAPSSGSSSVGDVTAAPGTDLTPAQVASKYSTQIAAASQATGVPPGILAGQIWQESKGIASTPGGGLMQLGPNEFQQYGGGNISDPGDNIMAGAKYMKALSTQFGGNMGAALRAYNSGPNGVDVNNLNSTPAGTGDPTYITKVMQAAQQSGLSTT
ncbi:lytic transglycosylase domain-containing protein [Paraburkholderia flava]|uniref:lytic transglycosylase domain-containing protein n=1 Tax=Paraburkholderia flava TaxID=2547393 RepID=UPI001061171F|nr:lytic transglycosylase domain-containing protein [Paraburkholderia flava]